VVDAAAVEGQRVLVYDDVFTCGLTLREIALALRRAGAVEVSGLVLARQGFAGAR
jgi:predicted amidophosphoribosyltransferase